MGIADVLVVMGILIAFFTFVTTRTTIGRQIYALGGNEMRFFAAGGIDKIGLKRSSLPNPYDMNSILLPRPEPQRRSLRRRGP